MFWCFRTCDISSLCSKRKDESCISNDHVKCSHWKGPWTSFPREVARLLDPISGIISGKFCSLQTSVMEFIPHISLLVRDEGPRMRHLCFGAETLKVWRRGEGFSIVLRQNRELMAERILTFHSFLLLRTSWRQSYLAEAPYYFKEKPKLIYLLRNCCPPTLTLLLLLCSLKTWFN